MLKKSIYSGIFFCALLVGALFPMASAVAQTVDSGVDVYVFERNDCAHCQDERAFLQSLEESRGISVLYLDVQVDAAARALFNRIAEAKAIPRVTPVTIIGTTLIQGYDVDETTGKRILAALERAGGESVDIESFILSGSTTETSGEGCAVDDSEVCDTVLSDEFLFALPFVGVVNLQTFSLATLSLVLGFIDGFNPCAMWVLVTFLLILMQIGNRKRMFQIAGLFILAQGIMYNLILNVWYHTWDFVGLDAIVTPLVGFVAIGGGLYFLQKYWRNRKRGLVCDVTSLEEQSKIEQKIMKIAGAPLTFVAALGVIGIAFSVNVVEFACSVGIPQAFTKILELNELGFWAQQGYVLLYTLAYMIDDFVVFGLALWGFRKLDVAGKYANLSSLIGGAVMLVLGALLIFFPAMLLL